MALGANIISNKEGSGEGLKWSNIAEPATVGKWGNRHLAIQVLRNSLVTTLKTFSLISILFFLENTKTLGLGI